MKMQPFFKGTFWSRFFRTRELLNNSIRRWAYFHDGKFSSFVAIRIVETLMRLKHQIDQLEIM